MHVQDKFLRLSDVPNEALRECPTIEGKSESLITHAIRPGSCLKRQRELYHKCHRCAYRGMSADFEIDRPPDFGAAPEVVRGGLQSGAEIGGARNGSAQNGRAQDGSAPSGRAQTGGAHGRAAPNRGAARRE